MTPAHFTEAVSRELTRLIPPWLEDWLRPETRVVERMGHRNGVIHVVGLRSTHVLEIPVGPRSLPVRPISEELLYEPLYGIWTTGTGAVAYPASPELLEKLDEEQAAWLVTSTAQALLGTAWLSGLLPPHKPQLVPPGRVRRAD